MIRSNKTRTLLVLLCLHTILHAMSPRAVELLLKRANNPNTPITQIQRDLKRLQAHQSNAADAQKMEAVLKSRTNLQQALAGTMPMPSPSNSMGVVNAPPPSNATLKSKPLDVDAISGKITEFMQRAALAVQKLIDHRLAMRVEAVSHPARLSPNWATLIQQDATYKANVAALKSEYNALNSAWTRDEDKKRLASIAPLLSNTDETTLEMSADIQFKQANAQLADDLLKNGNSWNDVFTTSLAKLTEYNKFLDDLSAIPSHPYAARHYNLQKAMIKDILYTMQPTPPTASTQKQMAAIETAVQGTPPLDQAKAIDAAARHIITNIINNRVAMWEHAINVKTGVVQRGEMQQWAMLTQTERDLKDRLVPLKEKLDLINSTWNNKTAQDILFNQELYALLDLTDADINAAADTQYTVAQTAYVDGKFAAAKNWDDAFEAAYKELVHINSLIKALDPTRGTSAYAVHAYQLLKQMIKTKAYTFRTPGIIDRRIQTIESLMPIP